MISLIWICFCVLDSKIDFDRFSSQDVPESSSKIAEHPTDSSTSSSSSSPTQSASSSSASHSKDSTDSTTEDSKNSSSSSSSKDITKSESISSASHPERQDAMKHALAADLDHWIPPPLPQVEEGSTYLKFGIPQLVGRFSRFSCFLSYFDGLI